MLSTTKANGPYYSGLNVYLRHLGKDLHACDCICRIAKGAARTTREGMAQHQSTRLYSQTQTGHEARGPGVKRTAGTKTLRLKGACIAILGLMTLSRTANPTNIGKPGKNHKPSLLTSLRRYTYATAYRTTPPSPARSIRTLHHAASTLS